MGGGIDEGCNEEGGTFVKKNWSLAFCDLKSHGGKKNAPLSKVMEGKKNAPLYTTAGPVTVLPTTTLSAFTTAHTFVVY